MAKLIHMILLAAFVSLAMGQAFITTAKNGENNWLQHKKNIKTGLCEKLPLKCFRKLLSGNLRVSGHISANKHVDGSGKY